LLSGAGARRREHRHRPGRADEGGERRVTDVQDDVGSSQGNISGHLACLKDCGLFADRPEGRAVWYRIAEPEVISVIRSAEGLLSRTGEKVELCPNYRPRPPR
jgi:DNA-binding transcriptional ArsR family regulator